MRARGLVTAARVLAGCRQQVTTASGGWLGIAGALRLDPPTTATGCSWSHDTKRYVSRWPFPKSGGVEGFPDQYMRSIEKRVVPTRSHEAPAAETGVFYGNMPDIGVERHLRGLSEETKTALGTILDIEHADTDVTLPSMREIDDEETEFQTLKAERKLALAYEQAKTKAARVSIRDEYGRSGATGKRKTAIARVTIWPGIGDMSCNKLHLDDAFPDIDHRGWMIKPFLVTNTMGLFDVKAIVTGGGKSGQAQAVRHGIAKALQLYEPAFRPSLKKAGMLTRDNRIVERKKPGLKKARKAFQWVKR